MEAGAYEVRLRTAENRLDASHRSISELRASSARHETEIKVAGTELRETREDIAEIRRQIVEARKEQKEEMVWVRRGLWAAAATFTTFIVALAALVLQAAG